MEAREGTEPALAELKNKPTEDLLNSKNSKILQTPKSKTTPAYFLQNLSDQ
jgi:rRNA pseudouridine-1189 N-methylase Emg1 (Nep1/Mra1 family)